jgi:hypothetical protein
LRDAFVASLKHCSKKENKLNFDIARRSTLGLKHNENSLKFFHAHGVRVAFAFAEHSSTRKNCGTSHSHSTQSLLEHRDDERKN